MISAVIPNWNRPDTLTKVILPTMERYSCIDEIVISHGKEETAFDYKSRYCRVVHREDWEINEEWGLARRFVAAKEAANEIIWQQDDDLLVPEETIAELLVRYRRQPNVVHGLHGLLLDKDLNYLSTLVYGEVILLAAKGTLSRRDLAARFFDPKYREIHDFVRENSFPLWNGEDIFHSLVAVGSSGLPNRAYDFPYVDLGFVSDNTEAVSRTLGHAEYRTKIVKYAVEKMGLQKDVIGLMSNEESRYVPPPPFKRNWIRQLRYARKSLKRWVLYFLLRSRMHFIRRKVLRKFAEKGLQRSRFRHSSSVQKV